MIRVLVRRLYAAARALDRMNSPFLAWLPSRWKRRFVRCIFRSLDRTSAGRRPVLLDGLRYYFPESLRGTFVLQEHEPGVRRLLAQTLKPSMRVVDVGANVGYHALYAAHLVGPEGRVWAVEPAEENLAYLRANVKENGLEQVEVVSVAAGAERARRCFQLRADAGHHGFFSHPVEATVAEVEVEVVPLDEIVPAPVDIIKIDVEGAEAEALAGLEKLLNKSPQACMLVEWNPPLLRSAGRDPDEVPRWLIERGFRLEVVDNEGRCRIFDPSRLDICTEHELWAVRP